MKNKKVRKRSGEVTYLGKNTPCKKETLIDVKSTFETCTHKKEKKGWYARGRGKQEQWRLKSTYTKQRDGGSITQHGEADGTAARETTSNNRQGERLASAACGEQYETGNVKKTHPEERTYKYSLRELAVRECTRTDLLTGQQRHAKVAGKTKTESNDRPCKPAPKHAA